MKIVILQFLRFMRELPATLSWFEGFNVVKIMIFRITGGQCALATIFYLVF